MDDKQILTHIQDLVDEEHRLESLSVEETSSSHTSRINEIEVALDQCWDLLRQRRARKLAGLDPDDASLRPPSVVEGYQQ
jgi:hypothetical protein